jgi:hypothetical protein
MTVSDEELQAQIDAINELPLEQRAEALTQAAQAVRELLDGTDS